MQGLEFMVTHDPSENDTKHDHNGVWVIRKQTRRKRQGTQDEIMGISSYFVVGENVYMAPSIGNILSSRVVLHTFLRRQHLRPRLKLAPQLSTVTSLTKMLSAASSLPDFTPALGHTYFPPSTQNSTPGSSLQPTQASESSNSLSAAATNVSLPATQEPTSTTKSSQPSKPSPSTDLQSSALLASSFDLLLQHGAEYMDENPLIGEPGSFKLSKAREPGVPASTTASQQPANQPLKANTTVAAKNATPLEVKTDVPSEAGTGRKGSGSAKSPTTPGIAKKKKERRKSKAVGGEEEEGGTPKGEG